MTGRDPLDEMAGKGFEMKDCVASTYTDNVYATRSREGSLEEIYKTGAVRYYETERPPLIGVLLSILLGIVLVVMAMGAILIVIRGADAHEATPTAAKPLGWSYPFSCCSGYDCRPVEDVKETSTGYVVRTGEVINYSGDARLKDSPDGMFHWCSVAGADDGRTICLFAPPRGF